MTELIATFTITLCPVCSFGSVFYTSWFIYEKEWSIFVILVGFLGTILTLIAALCDKYGSCIKNHKIVKTVFQKRKL